MPKGVYSQEMRIVQSIFAKTSAVSMTALLCVVLCSPTGAAPPRTIQYNRDVRPILADKCFRCHGADQAARQADMRLDEQKDATADRGGYRVISPGKSAASELIRRITSTDDDERMPPSESGLNLNAHQIEIIRRWIEQGAVYQKHWSFIPPQRPELPRVNNAKWGWNEIDRFVLARLEQEGLTSSPRASREKLIRRLCFDLTGLPPTPDEQREFLADRSPNAYERLVDRLLSSPSYGERWAQHWLVSSTSPTLHFGA
ncbi:MAG: DUF1549 domain-containing protein, partial [Planctomycetes bacterium]|nr:DUF1549 domain-containing protein [Planctomycetota bacterium]